MGAPQVSNVGAFLKVGGQAASRGIAAGAGDATEVTGASLDRLGYGSAKVVIVGAAVNTATKKLQLTSVKMEYSADGLSWDTPVEQLAAAYDLVTGTGAQSGSYTLNVDLGAQKRYMRVRYTPDHTASATDTFEVGLAIVLGGADKRPAA